MGDPDIDPTARIASGAVIGSGAQIGPYCTIGANVKVGAGVRLVSHVNVTGHTEIGERTVVHPFASLGTAPQSFGYRGGPTTLSIGAECDIREHVTMNTGTEDGGGATTVGNKCFFMVGSHVGHDCHVGNNVVVANNTLLGGHVEVGDFVVFGGGVAVRQFVRIGEGAMLVGLSGIRADVIPWGMAQGPLSHLVGLNVVGMRRRGRSKADVHALRIAYRDLFFGDGEFRTRVEKVSAQYADSPLAVRMIEFIRAGKRPLTMAINRAEADDAS
ncbi:MAG: acyl-ACP--UDP-N-acetylglucosamine O-acyltransferase [Pseudolabrys sp.]|jgi:UDP-N-acetylglucosamine acyltransferase